MKKPILLLAGLLIRVVAALFLYFSSSLSRTAATATFGKDEEQEGMIELRVEAPYGYYVIQYIVVPRLPGTDAERQPFIVGGRGIGK